MSHQCLKGQDLAHCPPSIKLHWPLPLLEKVASASRSTETDATVSTCCKTKQAPPKEYITPTSKRPRSGTSPSTHQAALAPPLDKVASASRSMETNATVLTCPWMKQGLPTRPAVLAPVTMKGAIASGMAQTSISASQGAQPPCSHVGHCCISSGSGWTRWRLEVIA